jgi:hypothetical protein
MNRATALASATIIAVGIASVGGMSYAVGNSPQQSVASATPHQFKYTLPAVVDEPEATFTFPGLSPVIYNANFSINAHALTPGATIECTFRRPSGSRQLDQIGASDDTGRSNVSASGALDMRHAGPIRLQCFASSGNFTLLTSSYASSVTFDEMGSTTVRSSGRA